MSTTVSSQASLSTTVLVSLWPALGVGCAFSGATGSDAFPASSVAGWTTVGWAVPVPGAVAPVPEDCLVPAVMALARREAVSRAWAPAAQSRAARDSSAEASSAVGDCSVTCCSGASVGDGAADGAAASASFAAAPVVWADPSEVVPASGALAACPASADAFVATP